MIHVENLTIRFEDTTALYNVSLNFNEGIIYGVVGLNGAGKTSLLRGLTGLVADFEGTVSFNDRDLVDDRQSIKKFIGYTPEETVLLPYLTGREFLELIAILRKVSNASAQINELLVNLGIKKEENTITDDYSHGMQKKLSLAAAFLGNPKYILIDEGLNGLDPQGLTYVTDRLKTLRHEQHTIIIASHDFELIAELCTHIIVLHEGRIIKEYSENELNAIETAGGDSFREHFKKLVQDFPDQKQSCHQE